MLKAILVLGFFLTLLKTKGQEQITISGYIMDKYSQEKLINANVFNKTAKTGVQSNVYGFYSFTLPKGTSAVFTFSYVGYSNFEAEVRADSTIYLDIDLEPKNYLDEVTVSATKETPIELSPQMGKMSIPISQIKALPALLGEVDVLKALQLLPGVQGGSEGSAGLYVRGGGPDQNLYLLDGVPVYNVNHLGGFFSTFNADGISNVDLYKGGFPARFGGRLSSVVDIRMKEGNKQKFGVQGGLGLLSSKLLVEGSINKGKGSFIVSGRRTYFDVLMAPIIKRQSDADENGGYYFYDLNAKLNYKLSNKDHIYLSGYFGKDKFYTNYKDEGSSSTSEFSNDLHWGNTTAVFRWNRIFTPQLFGNLSLSYSKYNFNTDVASTSQDGEEYRSSSLKLFSGIRDYTIKYDIDYLPNPKHSIKMGANAMYQSFTPTTNSFHNSSSNTENNSSVSIGDKQTAATTLELYGEDEVTISPKIKATAGLRISTFLVQNSTYFGIQPRLSARYLFHKNYSLKLSYVRMNQFINLLSFEGIGLPTDLWVPVTDRIKPQKSDQVAVGVSGSPSDSYEVSFEAYYKNMNNVIDYKDGSSYINTTGSYEDNVEMGIGRAYGGEWMIQKKEGRLQGMASYTLSWSQRKYPTINNGNWYNTRFDRRHDFKVAAIYKLSNRVELSGNWLYNTGAWTTLPTTNYPGVPYPNYLAMEGNKPWETPFNYMNDYIKERNNYRLMDYHRLDLGVKITKRKKKFERSWAFGCFNVYGRKNPFFLFQEGSEDGKNIYKQISLFGFPLPYVTYNFKFF